MQARQHNRAIFVCAGVLHLEWGVGLLLFPIGKVAAIANAVGDVGTTFASLLLIGIGVASLISTVVHRRWLAIALLVTQQYIMCLSAYAAYACARAGQYPDGTPASPSHIFHDQLIYMLFAVAHSYAMLETHAPEGFAWKA